MDGQSLKEKFMREALLEGKRALPDCLPNPPVGCVLVRDEEIVARGYTNRPGEDHAEAMALRQVDGNLQNVTAYVTLEPCSFFGRTASCAKTLIERQVGKVVVAAIDPDPRNSGRGIEMLEEAGVKVEIGVLEREALEDLSSYLIK